MRSGPFTPLAIPDGERQAAAVNGGRFVSQFAPLGNG